MQALVVGFTGLESAWGHFVLCYRLVRRKYPMQTLALHVSQEEVSHAGFGLTG